VSESRNSKHNDTLYTKIIYRKRIFQGLLNLTPRYNWAIRFMPKINLNLNYFNAFQIEKSKQLFKWSFEDFFNVKLSIIGHHSIVYNLTKSGQVFQFCINF